MSASNRNQPCQCGSGRKFKKCCGTAEAQAIVRQQEAERRKAGLIALKAKHDAEMAAKGYVPPKPIPSVILPMLLAAACGLPYHRGLR